MIVYEDLLNKLKIHFPRWMDIRRKINSSVGGAYLKSIAMTASEIQNAINDYKKDFFIDNYFGREDEILSFIYKMPVGIPKTLSDIKIINPENFKITNIENDFYDNDNYAYYNDGNLYFKQDLKSVEYTIDNFKCSGNLEKIHVWNIFDEFAAFLDLRRYQWETNKELENRILAYGKVSNKVNSSASGLKKALIANLINIAPNLKPEDISIERPTAENLRKYYDEFETILDHMSKINRDVYKEKQWDIDKWNFNIKSIDYIPHAWDVLLNDYVNGVGFKDDLKVEFINQNQKCDVSVFFYKKQLDTLNAYIKNHNIKKDIDLALTKYNENIIENEVKYRITAAETKKLNTDKISLKAIEEKTGVFKLNLQDIISKYNPKTVKETDYSILSSDYNYVIDFIPKDEIGDFSINYLKQVDLESNKTTNLLDKNKSGFESNGDGVRSTASKCYINDLYELKSYENLKKTVNGFEISDLSKAANLSIDLNGYRLNPVYYEYETKDTILNLSEFKLKNCYIYNNCIISDTVADEKTAELDIELNSFSAVIEGPYKIEYHFDDEDPVIIEDENNNVFNFKLDKTNTPRKLHLKITFLNEGCKIKDTKYSKYEFLFSLENGSFSSNNSELILPNVENNTLTFIIKSYIGFSPVLKYIYIGNKLSESNGYYNIHVNTNNGTKILTKFNNCRMQLKQYSKETNELINTFTDYKPYKEYKAEEDTFMILDLKDYIISKIDCDKCSIKQDSSNNINKIYTLVIPENVSIMDITLYGTCYMSIVDCTLSSIINKLGYNLKNHEFYVTRNENSIIVKNSLTKNTSYLKIRREDLFDKTTSTTIEVINEDDNIKTKFIESDNIVMYSDKCNTDFDFLSFEPIRGNIYTAINAYIMTLSEEKDIQIVNTFNNSYNPNNNEIMFYTIESLNEDFTVRFQTDSVFEYCDEKCLDEKNIIIKGKDISKLDYNNETIKITLNLSLGSTIDLPQTFLYNSQECDLRKYIIDNKNKINYFNKYNDSDNELDYEFSESFKLINTKIIKLKFSNIHEIESVFCGSNKLLENEDYSVLLKEGIITFKDNTELTENTIRIDYNIDVAKSIDVNIDELYKVIDYPVNSMTLLNEVQIKDLEIDTPVDLNKYSDYKASDLVSVQCSKPGFLTRIDSGNLIISNNTPKNSIAVKTGYYYLNGREYYLLANEKYDNINKVDNINYHNVEKDNYNLILKQKNNNFLENTAFNLNTKSEIYNLKCSDKNISPISNMLEISACDTFNYWNSYMCSLGITDGYNSQGLKFKSYENEDGYCYISLKKYLEKNKQYTMSFYLKGGSAFLGKEKIIENQNELNFETLIGLETQIQPSKVLQDFNEVSFDTDDTKSYYLILTGSGVIDDIIISETDSYDIYNHVKNLSKLNLDIDENIYTDYKTRLYVTDENGALFSGTELNKNNEIINSSYIDWGFTKLKEILSYDDFKQCNVSDVYFKQFDNKCSVISGSKPGRIETPPIYINNTNIIKSLLFKVNNILFDKTKDLEMKILTSNNKNSGYKEISNSKNNICISEGNTINKYVKLEITIPAGKVLNSIEVYAEYLSDDENAPSEMDVTNGTYTSKVLDAQYNERFHIKDIGIESISEDIDDYVFQIRASKENTDNTVWTEWKTIEVDSNFNITNRIIFDGFRYYQFRIAIKGENGSIKINYIDLEVV